MDGFIAPPGRARRVPPLMFVRTLDAGNQKLSARPRWARRLALRARWFFFGIRPTSAGLGALGLTVLIGLAAFNTGTNLLYVMLATLLACGSLSLLYGRINLAFLTPERRLPREIHAGEPVEMEWELGNSKRWLWSYGIGLREIGPRETPPAAAFFLTAPGRRSVHRRLSVQFERRGLMALDLIELSSSFPFGLVEYRTRFSRPAEVLVLPRLVPVRDIRNRQSQSSGERQTPVRGHGSSLFSIRDYVVGDPSRSIHWKLSAKGMGVKVRENEHEDSRRAIVGLNFKSPAAPTAQDAERFERAISVAASLARELTDGGAEVGLWTAAGSIELGRGAGHLRRIMRALALIEIGECREPRAAPRLEPGCGLLWVGEPGSLAIDVSTGGLISPELGSGHPASPELAMRS